MSRIFAKTLLTHQTKKLELNRRGYVIASESGRTSRLGVWAGGDIVTGIATVILAMGAAKTAARDIRHDLVHGRNKCWFSIQHA